MAPYPSRRAMVDSARRLSVALSELVAELRVDTRLLDNRDEQPLDEIDRLRALAIRAGVLGNSIARALGDAARAEEA